MQTLLHLYYLWPYEAHTLRHQNSLEKNLKVKEILRQEISAITASLDQEYINESDKRINEWLIDCEQYRNAKVIFTYVGIESEISTFPIIEHAIATGKRVCAPVVKGKGIMDAKYMQSVNELVPNPRGLLEPDPTCEIAEPTDIDLVVVPCLSCDPFGNRIGYGGGYYDRYLKRIDKQNSCFISVCRTRTLSMNLPHGQYDVGMNYYLTEEGIFSCASAI